VLHMQLAWCNSQGHIAFQSLFACQIWLLQCMAVMQGSYATQGCLHSQQVLHKLFIAGCD